MPIASRSRVSSSVRLDLTSGHRLPVAVDGVLLMGNELILGSGPEAHVVLPGVPTPVLIYRSKDGLGVRVADTQFTIDELRAAVEEARVRDTYVLAHAYHPKSIANCLEAIRRAQDAGWI